MTLTAATRIPYFGDAGSYSAQEVRLLIATLLSELGGTSGNQLGIGGGVRPSSGSPLKVSVGSGLSVSVNPGSAAIQASSALNAGAYVQVLDSTVTLTCTAADTVNPRVDLVCLTTTDTGTAAPTGAVQIVTGTPASSPSAPALPANSIPLCCITVPQNAVGLVSGNLADQRQFLATGIKNVLNSSFYPTVGDVSHFLFDSNLGRLRWFNGTSVVAPKISAFAPAFGPAASGTANSTTPVVVTTATAVTVDGITTAEVTVSWKDINTAGTSSGNACTVSITRDGSIIASVVKTCRFADDTLDGGSFTFPDQNPTAGSHTYALTIANQGAGIFQVVTGNIMVKALSN